MDQTLYLRRKNIRGYTGNMEWLISNVGYVNQFFQYILVTNYVLKYIHIST